MNTGILHFSVFPFIVTSQTLWFFANQKTVATLRQAGLLAQFFHSICSLHVSVSHLVTLAVFPAFLLLLYLLQGSVVRDL